MSWTEYYTVPAAVRNHKQNGIEDCHAPVTSEKKRKGQITKGVKNDIAKR